MTHPAWLRAAALVGFLFGLLTIREGSAVLFGAADDAARLAAGDYVPFVLWFNFLAGFVYVIAATGLAFLQRWAVRMALAIAVATLAVFGAFGVHVMTGGAFELRTIVAMTLRCAVWFAIAALGWRVLQKRS